MHQGFVKGKELFSFFDLISSFIVSFTDKELTNWLFKAPNWLQNVSRQAVMLYLILDIDKELTNSLLLASDWLTISVCVIWFDKERYIEKRNNMTNKIPHLLQNLD